ncbi:MAG: archaeal heat shock protein Hsp14 [Nitrososphaera sp.]
MGLAGIVAKGMIKELDYRAREFYEFVLPAIDMYEEKNDLVVVIDLPGFAKQDINLKVTGRILSINARREEPEKVGTVYYRHRPTRISKRIELPISVRDDETVVGNATYEHGVVRLRIPIPQSTSIPIS